MGLPFSPSLQKLFERVSVPLHDLFHHGDGGASGQHEMLWECYASGQMTDRDLEREIAADPQFAAFVKQRESRYH